MPEELNKTRSLT